MAFLGIKITNECGRLLKAIDVPGEKEGPSEYHITILCFEDNWPITEISKALEATYKIISDIKPFLIKTNKVKCFPKRENKPCPIICSVDSDDLHDLNEKIKKEFDKQDIYYSKVFKDYKPHITLAYADKEIEEFEIDPIEFSVQEIILWGGDMGDDRVFITFPLKSPERKKHSYLLQKVELFYKLASNPGQTYFAPSYERRKIER